MGLQATSKTEIATVTGLYERAREHLKLFDDSQMDEVIMYLEAAVDDAETYMSRPIFDITYVYTLPGFPGTRLSLPRAQVKSVSSVAYYDESGAQQTLSTDYYRANLADDLVSTITLKENYSWPDTDNYNPESVEVTFTAGYGTAMQNVPGLLLTGIILYAGELFVNRSIDWKGVGSGAIHATDIIRDRFFSRYKARWI